MDQNMDFGYLCRLSVVIKCLLIVVWFLTVVISLLCILGLHCDKMFYHSNASHSAVGLCFWNTGLVNQML